VRFPKSLAAALALVLCLALTGCTHGEKKQARKPPDSTQTSAVQLDLVPFGNAESVSPARVTRPLDEATRAAGLAVVQKWFEASSLDPLLKGKAGSIDAIFTSDAVRQAATLDRNAMYDEGLPRVSRVKATQHTVQLIGFNDDADQPSILVAKFVWDLHGDGTRVHVARHGELILTPGFGLWFVSAYEVTAERTVNGVTTTTTAAKQ
jgi:hypothetical protein